MKRTKKNIIKSLCASAIIALASSFFVGFNPNTVKATELVSITNDNAYFATTKINEADYSGGLYSLDVKYAIFYEIEQAASVNFSLVQGGDYYTLSASNVTKEDSELYVGIYYYTVKVTLSNFSDGMKGFKIQAQVMDASNAILFTSINNEHDFYSMLKVKGFASAGDLSAISAYNNSFEIKCQSLSDNFQTFSGLELDGSLEENPNIYDYVLRVSKNSAESGARSHILQIMLYDPLQVTFSGALPFQFYFRYDGTTLDFLPYSCGLYLGSDNFHKSNPNFDFDEMLNKINIYQDENYFYFNITENQSYQLYSETNHLGVIERTPLQYSFGFFSYNSAVSSVSDLNDSRVNADYALLSSISSADSPTEEATNYDEYVTLLTERLNTLTDNLDELKALQIELENEINRLRGNDAYKNEADRYAKRLNDSYNILEEKYETLLAQRDTSKDEYAELLTTKGNENKTLKEKNEELEAENELLRNKLSELAETETENDGGNLVIADAFASGCTGEINSGSSLFIFCLMLAATLCFFGVRYAKNRHEKK